MSFKCKIGLHSWENCKCINCGKMGEHIWDGCRCEICGIEKHSIINCKCISCGKFIHEWDGCKCSNCGKFRDEQHDFKEDCEECSICGKKRNNKHQNDGCICKICKKENHHSVNCICTNCGKRVHDPSEALNYIAHCKNCGRLLFTSRYGVYYFKNHTFNSHITNHLFIDESLLEEKMHSYNNGIGIFEEQIIFEAFFSGYIGGHAIYKDKLRNQNTEKIIQDFIKSKITTNPLVEKLTSNIEQIFIEGLTEAVNSGDDYAVNALRNAIKIKCRNPYVSFYIPGVRVLSGLQLLRYTESAKGDLINLAKQHKIISNPEKTGELIALILNKNLYGVSEILSEIDRIGGNAEGNNFQLIYNELILSNRLRHQ